MKTILEMDLDHLINDSIIDIFIKIQDWYISLKLGWILVDFENSKVVY